MFTHRGRTPTLNRMATTPGPLRALIVDDEAPALSELAWLLGQDNRIGRIRTAESGAQALKALESEPVDVLFCDISMPGLDGLDLARVLARFSHRPHLIFVTAYDQHAIEAFDLQAVDYVLKPVRADRLAEAVRRVVEAGRPAEPAPPPPPADETIAVELGGITRFVQRSAVLFVEAQGDYARLHTATSSHLIRIPLTALEERWAPAGFVRIHRSTLVALAHVDEVRMDGGRFFVRLAGRTLQVSRRHSRELRELLVRGASLSRPSPR
jgi:DNA-binding LytR/AlgR family response regulator